MPKVLLYITAKITWIFLFYGSDVNENRAHVHVGKKGMDNFCKLWLEPIIEIADAGELTQAQLNEVIEIASEYQSTLLQQWTKFQNGTTPKMITIKK